MNQAVLDLNQIQSLVKPIASKYAVSAVYIFGSYARGEATWASDLDFLVVGGEGFRKTNIFALAEELREVFNKDVDVFEIDEINENSSFYENVMSERKLVA